MQQRVCVCFVRMCVFCAVGNGGTFIRETGEEKQEESTCMQQMYRYVIMWRKMELSPLQIRASPVENHLTVIFIKYDGMENPLTLSCQYKLIPIL